MCRFDPYDYLSNIGADQAQDTDLGMPDPILFIEVFRIILMVKLTHKLG